MSAVPAKDPAERLVVVSNRLPYDLPTDGEPFDATRHVGGLVNALEPVLERIGGTWVGWNGAVVASRAAADAAVRETRPFVSPGGARFVGVPLSERELLRYYNGYCNRTLWPLLHGFVGKAVFDPDEYAFYERVNHRFAERAFAAAGAGGRIWVHDFHLALVPAALRALGFRGRIDFFLHTPFPPLETFRALPERERILDGLLAADAVAFHVPHYRDNFVAAARELRGAFALPHGDEALLARPSGIAVALAAPIGIDVAGFARLASAPTVRARARRIRAAHGGRPILFAADRLDYTKGIRERMAAIDHLLRARPGLHGAFDVVQVVVPSRHQVEEYRQLKRDVDRDVGRINGEHGRDGWTPIHYRYCPFDREELVAHYLAAAAALVTPLRDGMNLVAPEFVASRVDGDGVLVCSEFAGAADMLPGALLVNPYDVRALADACEGALLMAADERRARMARLRRAVAPATAELWARRCLAVESAAPI